MDLNESFNAFWKSPLESYKESLAQYRLTLKPPLPPQINSSLLIYFPHLLQYPKHNMPQKLLELAPEKTPIAEKILMYTWQVVNFYYMSNAYLHEEHGPLLHQLATFTINNSKQMQRKTLKAMLISLYNMMKNQNINHDAVMIQEVLAWILKEENLQDEVLEWSVYLLELCMSRIDGFLKLMIQKGNSEQKTLHFINHLLNKIVDDRSSTELVKGYECPIEGVREMYNQKGIIHLKLSWTDYEYFINDRLLSHLAAFKAILRRRVAGLDFSEAQYQQTNITLLNIIVMGNCVLFLGGYSPLLQQKTSSFILKPVLELLQISFLIYSIGSKRKIRVKIPINYTQMLCKVLGIEYEEKMEGRLSGNMIEDGQLTSIIRILSNLVHINEEAQKYFEDNLEYFRMIMSLTHESEAQMTMKNWAIVFLRNVSERSQIMRGQLEKLQINMKVEQ